MSEKCYICKRVGPDIEYQGKPCHADCMPVGATRKPTAASDPQTRPESGVGADTPPDAVLAALARQWKAEADAKAITAAHRDLVKDAKKAVREAYREWKEGQGQIGWDEVPGK